MKFTASLALALTLLLTACGGPTRYVLQGTAVARGTDGALEVEFGESNNHLLLEIKHLPPPERIDPGSTLYLVWEWPAEGTPPNLLGRHAYDPDARTGRLEATTAFSNFTLLVTAESEEAPEAPSAVVVARQDVSHN